MRRIPPAARALALLAVIAAVAGSAGCNRTETRRVHARLTDHVHRTDAMARPSTAGYQFERIGEQTRPVLAPGGDAGGDPSPQPFSVKLDVPDGAELEVGFGVPQDGIAADDSVTFEITATVDDELFGLLSETVGGEGNEIGVWHDVRVDLAPIVGEAALELTVSSAGGYFSEPIITVPVEPETAHPYNLILISIDALRADRMGVYGHEADTTPNIDRIFGQDGLVVERCYTNAADTRAAHAAMMTGLLPTTVLLDESGEPHLAEWAPMLADELRAAGYRTAAFTENAWVSGAFGFRRGFERYDEASGVEKGTLTPGKLEQTFERTLDWIANHADQPFFLFAQTYQIGPPYDAPGPYADRFPVPDNASPETADSVAYDREVRYVDAVLGDLVSALDRLGVGARTLLVVTSDHGEEIGEHGRRGHGTNLHDEVLRVPLLMRAPDLLPPGTRWPGPMGLVALTPTLLDLIGREPPADVDGDTFASHILEGAPPEPVAIYHEARSAEAATYDGPDPTWIAPSFAVTTWPWRLIRVRTPNDGTRYELYDLANDPGETSNLYEARADAVAFTRARLDRYDEFRRGRRAALAVPKGDPSLR